MAYETPEERKARRAQVERENAEIKRERDRQNAIAMGERQGWVNPNLYTPQERRDRQLERAGLLNYQTRGLSQGDIAARFADAGIRVNPDTNWFKQKTIQAVQGQGARPQAQQPRPTNAQSLYASMVFAKPEDVAKGQANWTDLSTNDRANILKNPAFYQSGQITQYAPAVQQEILKDPNFDWEQLPKWQQTYYSVSSNPAAMGAVQGTIMGMGNPLGTVLGTGLGWAAGVVGYDPSKEFWQQGDDNNRMDLGDFARGAFGLLNFAAEQAEKGIGLMLQSAAILTGNDPNFDPNKRNLDIQFNPDFNLFAKPGEGFNPNLIIGSSWDAGASTFEVLGPAIAETSWKNSFQNIKDKIEAGESMTVRDFARFFPGIAFGDMLINPDEYKGEEWYLGSAVPIPLQQNFYERMNEAEQRINAGEPYREVMLDFQQGIKAQVSDLAGQAIADPLNVVGTVEAGGGSVLSRLAGDKVAAAAFDQSLQGGNPGLMDAQARLRNIVNAPGEAVKIDPNYNVKELGAISRFMAGLTSDGKVTAGGLSRQGLLDYTPPKKNLRGAWEYLTSLTPESRARVGQDLLLSNVGRIMSSYFNGSDVVGFANWWKAFSNGDMTQAADLSRAMANSPEFYTVLPAAKNFDMDAAVTKWTATDDARQAVTQIADVLGENPMSMIEDMAKRGTADQDFTRLREKLAQTDTPEARALLAAINDGRFTSQMLQDTVKLFSNGDVPYHPGQWMAQTLKDIQDHYDQWAINHFKLDAEAKKTLFRMSAVLKSAQSVLLLGANPGYMISNVLPTMVTRAMSGVWGYMTPKAIDSFLTRMGFDPDAGLAPNRLDEGVGPGGVVDQARGQGDVIREATRGKGILTKIENAVNGVGRNMPFNKLSRLLEGYEGKQAYLVGMKKFWGEAWRRGKAFRNLPSGLINELQRVAGPRAADILYSAIEAGMNKQEIQNIVSSATRTMQSRAMLNDAATRLNIPTSRAASLFEQAGIFDALDASLKGVKNQSQIERAFSRVAETARRSLYEQTARDAIANIEHVANKLQTEGMKAVTDIILDTEDAGIEQWLRHYQRMGEVADAVESLDNPQTRSNLWSLKYAESSAEFRRHNAHKGSVYLGVLKALGQDTNPTGRALLANLASTDATLDAAYRTMRQLRDEHFKKWNNDWENPRRGVERSAVERQIEQAWNEATKTEIENSRKFGELLGQQYEAAFGIEAGEAARQAWEQITAFRQEMTVRRDAFRRSIEGLPTAQRQIESQKFWGETYKYMIVEMQRIKTEAITQLDRIANKRRPGGDMTGPLAPNDPNAPTQPPAGMTQDEFTRLRQQAEERYNAQQAKISAVWDVAEQYGYNRENTSGVHGLLGALKSEEYGGDPTFTGGLKEATDRWTPDEIEAILERRRQVKDTNNQERIASRNMEYQASIQRAAADASKRTITENTPLIEAIRRHGGIDWAYVEQVTGDKKPPINQRSIFSKTGKNRWGLDEMARILADDGYPINLDSIDDPGGIQQTVDLIQRAYRGEQIFPMGSPRGEALLDASIARAEADFIERIAGEEAFDPDGWMTGMMDAFETLNSRRMAELVEQIPDELLDEQATVTETYREYIERSMADVDTRVQEQEQAAMIAENTARAERAIQDVQTEAETGFTRAQFRESLTDVFGLTDDMADAVMDITDARANAYGDVNEWYRTRIADVQRAGDIDLAQEAWHGSPSPLGEGSESRIPGTFDNGYDPLSSTATINGKKIKAVEGATKRVFDNGNTVIKVDLNDYKTQSNSPSITEAVEIQSAPDSVKKHLPKVFSTGELIGTDGKKYFYSEVEKVKPLVSGRSKATIFDYTADIQYGEGLRQAYSVVSDHFGKGDIQGLDNWGMNADGEFVLLDVVNWNKREQKLKAENDAAFLERYNRNKGNAIVEELSKSRLLEVDYDDIASGKLNVYDVVDSLTKLKEYLPKRAAEIDQVLQNVRGLSIDKNIMRPQFGKGEPNYHPKAGVRFMEDGRAIIRAWEGKSDVSSIVHELGHIFRRDLQGADLQTIEQWAGVKDGNWTREAEEQFARGFEKYLADGSAPTPKLRTVFEKFKTWMVEIYRAIAGSPIDIDLTPQVKEVFDRLLTGQEQPRSVDLNDQLFQMGYDPKAYYVDAQGNIKRRGELNIRVDKKGVAREAEAVLSSDFARKLQETKRTTRTGEGVDPYVSPRRGNTHELSYDEFKANIFAEQKARAEQMLERLAKVEAGELAQDAVPDLMRTDLKKVRDADDILAYRSVPVTVEEVRAKYVEMRDRNTISYEMYGDIRERWMGAVERALMEAAPVREDVKQAYYAMKKTSGERMQGAGQELFQMAEPTDTPEFKRWFGNSKVVDENGRPLVVYHGTKADFNVFKTEGKPKDAPGNLEGIYFADRTDVAEAYGNTTMPVYLSLKKPFEGNPFDYYAEKLGVVQPTWGSKADVFDNYKKVINADKVKEYLLQDGYDGVIRKDKGFKEYTAFEPTQIKSVANRGTWDPNDPNVLFQEADPRMPLGGYDESAGWFPQSQAMDEIWTQEFQPLLDGMRDVAVESLTNPTMDGVYSRLSPDAQKQLNNYLKGVQQDMASTKMAAQRWGQERRDFAMLNYNRRTGFDQWLDIAFPYQFFYTRSMMTWAARAIDNPAILANYARVRRQQDRYENNLPERLRGKMRIEAPYLPDWMGDALYIDPLSVLFTPHNFLRPFEQMAKDSNMQTIEAERILQEWAADGTIAEQQIIEAAQTRSGTTWERALAEAKMRRESQIANPMDFVSATFGPAWYLTTPAKMLGIGKEGAETITELPLTRTARAFDTVTQNTWAEPIGDVIGLLAKPEEKFRKANNLPEFGEYGDYYIDRQLANMVAEGLITSEDATIAMIERQGELFDEARERVKMELAMRVPLMGATYAGLNSDDFFSGLGNFIQALPPSLFGAGLLPEGELEFRAMKQEWDDAWKLRDAGDTEAITRFFEENPEYEAYLAKGKEPEERLRSFLIGQIWDGYMGLGATDRKSATAELGEEFLQAFLDSETRSYDTLDIETLTQWAQMLNKKVPAVEQTLPAIENPRSIDFFAPEVTAVTDQYFEQRSRLYPDYYDLQNQYYNLPTSERRAFLIANPSLKEYWDWNRSWKSRYPSLTPIFEGKVFKRVDTTTWNPMLVQYVADYAYSGAPLGPGAYKALEQIWINEGMPRGDFETWLKNDVAPSFLYGQ